MAKKDLYMAKSLEELEAFIINEKVKPTSSSPKYKLLAELKELLEMIEAQRISEDEEKCYVWYMQFMKLLSELEQVFKFCKKKSQFLNMIGSNTNIEEHIDRIEVLKASLQMRYEESYPAEVAQTEESSKQMNFDEESTKEVFEVIDCKALRNMLKRGEEGILIMDCRPAENYEESKIDCEYTMNVPEAILKPGMTASKIQNLLPNDSSRVLWKICKNRRFIIFVDRLSKRINRNSPVCHLKTILTKWCWDVERKPEMLLLEGGYEKWKKVYPMRCSKPQSSAPNTNDGDKSSQPQVEVNMKTSLQLLEESKQLMNMSLKNKLELLALETDYEQIESNKENDEDSAAKKQSCLFKIYELESKQGDFNFKVKSLKEQLDLNKGQVQEAREMAKVMQDKQHGREIEMQRDRVRQERELKRKKREEVMKLAFEKKLAPKLGPVNQQRITRKSQRMKEINLSPKAHNQVKPSSIQSFDRAAKRFRTVDRQIFSDQDFAPAYGQVERGLTGLRNLGNTCYMNSVIQCLSNTSALTDFLLNNELEKHVNNCDQTKGHIVTSLAAVIRMLWKGDCKYISTRHLKSVISEQGRLFHGMDQHDSHEFLIMLIDWLQSDIQTISVHSAIKSLPASEKAWLKYTKGKESFILRLFYGQIKSTIKCMVCSKGRTNYETFSNLSLELPPDHLEHCDINDCLDLYFHGEIVKGWNCPHCKAPRDAIKKLDISKLPPVLVIHLKRFYADSHTPFSYQKMNVYVDFPLTDLKLSPYVARTKKNSDSCNHIYKLYAVSNHYGTMDSGHYTAFCKNYVQEKWHKFDDKTVSPLKRSDVKSSAAYILFYTTNDEE